jgi:monovalent cation/hydrogen antiporter
VAGLLSQLRETAVLALGLVGFTALFVAMAGARLFSGFDWQIGIVLAATVGATDAIAATSIAKRVGLPKPVVDLLEGERLLNNAAGLLAPFIRGGDGSSRRNPTANSGWLRLFYLSFAGIGSGLILARIVEWFEHRIEDGPIQVTISVLLAYAAYMTANLIHASGALAVRA